MYRPAINCRPLHICACCGCGLVDVADYSVQATASGGARVLRVLSECYSSLNTISEEEREYK